MLFIIIYNRETQLQQKAQVYTKCMKLYEVIENISSL